MSIRNVKLPPHKAGLPEKEISLILCPLIPPIPFGGTGYVPVNINMMRLAGPVPDH